MILRHEYLNVVMKTFTLVTYNIINKNLGEGETNLEVLPSDGFTT